MKRNEMIKTLLKEGFSEKTLVKFSDKQISSLYERILSEADIMISKKDPQALSKIEDAKKQNKSIETYEEKVKEEEEYCDSCDRVKSKCVCNDKKEVKEWVKSLANENFHSFTSKNEIMELIKIKLNEVEVGPGVKKGHNGIPEFMSYDEIIKTEVKEQGTITKPAPTKPKVSPGTKPRTPYSPKPGEKSKPKALKEKTMQISKKNLLSLIENNIKEMAMDFDTPDRPNQGLQDKLAQGDTPLKKVPLPSTGQEPNKNFQEVLASERYRQVVSNLRKYLGDNAPVQQGMDGVMSLQRTLINAHNTVVQIERNHREELEQLAIELVMKEMGIPEGAIEYDAKIIGMGEVDMDDFNHDEDNEENPEQVEVENEIEIFNELQGLDLEKSKRRMINAIIQGASNKGHYMFHLVPERLQQITGQANILNLYGTLMSINDLTYWQISDDLIKGLGNSAAGKESAEGPEEEGGPGKVIARGINFPVLVHELIKGTLELFALQGRPEGEIDFEDVESSEDTLEKEMWDLRLGPAIWDRVRSQFPEDILTDENKIELQNYLLVEIFKLPARKFLVLIKEVLSGSERGKQMMNELMDGINKMFNDQDYEDSIAMFRDNLDDANDETSENDLRNTFGNLNFDELGISFSGEDDEDEDDEDGDIPVRR